jgi:hypothetical protein
LKVVIITYYWPPAGGSGVQRWLYFVKYLRDYGIEPIIFTVQDANYPILDDVLMEQIPERVEVIKNKIWEPNKLFKKKSTKTSAGFLQQKPSLKQRILHYIRANYFIPDARKFWVNSSVRKLNNYLKTNPVDWIITTGPPHSVHLIGKKLHQKTQIKWLADFRDPWTKIDYFHQLPLTKRSLKKHRRLEASVVSEATKVTVVGNEMQRDFLKFNKHCQVITNGYDGAIVKVSDLDEKFTLTHIGMLNADRNPYIFWEALREIIDENETFESLVQVNLVGKIADEVKMTIRKFDLEKYINYGSYIPHHAVQQFQAKSQVLLLFVNKVPSAKGIITGKVFEYLQAKRPILAIAPTDGDLADIIRETQSGKVLDFEDKEALKEQILHFFKSYESGNLHIESVAIDKYSRKNLTGELAKLLKK